MKVETKEVAKKEPSFPYLKSTYGDIYLVTKKAVIRLKDGEIYDDRNWSNYHTVVDNGAVIAQVTLTTEFE